MKKLLPVLALLTAAVLPAPPLVAASPWTVTNSAALDGKIGKLRLRGNKTTCAFYALGPSCTQAQARDKFCQRAGFPAAPCDGSTSVVIHSTDEAWAQDFWVSAIKTKADELKVDATQTFESAWLAGQTGPALPAACTAYGLPAGCTQEAVACAALGMTAPCRE